MKNILIIGGSYFVGKVFVEELAKGSDYSIYVVNRGNRPLNIAGVKEIVSNRNNVEQLRSSLPRLEWDVIVDFCAYKPKDVTDVMAVLSERSFQQYILISTTSIYQDTLDLPVREDNPKLTGPQPELGPQASFYGFGKWQTEQELMKHCQARQAHYTCLRPSIIYGKYNYAPRERYFFDLIYQSKIVILPEIDLALFQFVSVWDVAHIIMACMGNEKAYDKAFNLAAEELISYRRFVDVIREVSGKRVAVRSASIEAINQQRIPLPFPMDKHLIYSGRLMQEALDVRYTPFREGMKQTYDYYALNEVVS
jgi:nucleoside-diphosphate-sugar epimerase